MGMKVAQHCPCYVKSLKLADHPTMRQLTQQLDLCTHQLPSIAYHTGNLDLELGQVTEEDDDVFVEPPSPEPKLDSDLSAQAEEHYEPAQKKRCLQPTWADRLAGA